MFYILFSFVIFCFVFYFFEMFTISKKIYHINDSKINNDYTIVHLSDFHGISFPFKNKELMNKVKKAKPNIIVVTGDIVMKQYKMENTLLMMKQLKEIAPVYFIRGNHDLIESNSYILLEELDKIGIIIAETKTFDLGNNIVLTGLMDFLEDKFKNEELIEKERIKNLNKLNFNNFKYNILMTHRPYDFELYSKYDIDLVLCGHTHGGQWIFPFLGGFISPGRDKIFPKYDYGLKEEFGKKMIINRGLGGLLWAIRLNNRPELGIIKLKRG